jgi:hypothetical protein
VKISLISYKVNIKQDNVLHCHWARGMVLNETFNNISVISLQSVFEVGVGNVYSKLFMIVRPEYQWQYLNPAHGEVYNIQHYVIKFVSDLRQVCGFLQVQFTETTVRGQTCSPTSDTLSRFRANQSLLFLLNDTLTILPPILVVSRH